MKLRFCSEASKETSVSFFRKVPSVATLGQNTAYIIGEGSK
jgi:hypothetical protein